MKRRMPLASLLIACSVAGMDAPAAAQVVLLHSLAGGTSDGQSPIGSLAVSGSNLYGFAESGGSAGLGVVFTIGTDGSGYGVIHNFAGTSNDGGAPAGAPTIYQSSLYGVTQLGGSAGQGTVFNMALNGANFGTVRSFAGSPSDGGSPAGSLSLSGNTFFGATAAGGTANKGTIFTVNADGSGYASLHSFVGGAADGAYPALGAPAVSGSTLYGMTSSGGVANAGVVYTVNADGTDFAILHSFTFSVNDGFDPFGSVIVVGSTIYGMTQGGGSSGNGTIFKMNTDGSGFALLHSFAAGPNDGRDPMGELLLSGSTLYGMTYRGGSADDGTIFSLGLDGSNYGVLHAFIGGPNDGANPFGDLIQVGSTYYGTTVVGGANNDGTVFSFTPVPEPSSLLLTAAGGVALLARRKRRGRGRKCDSNISIAEKAPDTLSGPN